MKMDTYPFCVFKCKETIESKIILFTEEKLKLCQEKLNIRVAYKLKYENIILPSVVSNVHGYHSPCYKNFISIQKKYTEMYKKHMLQTSTVSSDLGASSSLVQPDNTSGTSNADEEQALTSEESQLEMDTINVCLFCNQNRKRVNYAEAFMHCSTKSQFRDVILANAKTLQDDEMLSKLESMRPNQKICYHNSCKFVYLRKHINAPTMKRTEWHERREFHEAAFNTVYEFIQNNVILNKRCYLLQLLTDIYREVFDKKCTKANISSNAIFTSQLLLDKLTAAFGDKIQIIIMHKKKIVGPKSDCIINEDTFSQLQEYEAFQRNAFALRRKILSIVKKPLSKNLEVNDLIAEECDIPQAVTDFFITLICGTDTMQDPNCSRRIHSIMQDVIYAVHHGKIKISRVKLRRTITNQCKGRIYYNRQR